MVSLIQIGNAQGIQIPKHLIKKAKLANVMIELVLTQNGLLLKPIAHKKLRQGWDKPQNKDMDIETEFLHVDSENIWEW